MQVGAEKWEEDVLTVTLSAEKAECQEPLETLIPGLFGRYLKERKVRIMGRPKLLDLASVDGGIRFQVRAESYLKVLLGDYKKIRRTAGQEGQDAAMRALCAMTRCNIPSHMVEYKLAAMEAQEKLRVDQDAIYHVLADVTCYLKAGYEAADVVRSMTQIREEALDVMLQTVSGDQKEVSADYLKAQIAQLAGRYHALPKDYSRRLDQIMEDRREAKRSMEAKERTEEVFRAYLGTLGLDEAQWKRERTAEAARSVKEDLALDALAEAEGIFVTEQELEDELERIAKQSGAATQEVRAKADPGPIREHIRRVKARRWLMEDAG